MAGYLKEQHIYVDRDHDGALGRNRQSTAVAAMEDGKGSGNHQGC